MAENLRYNIEGSWCYDNDEANCQKYGRLYTWDAAKKACPAGWHLPSRKEWRELIRAVDSNAQLGEEDWDYDNVAGKMLKSQTGWNVLSGIENKDTFGFSALPGGARFSNGSFDYVGDGGYWWTAPDDGSGNAYYRGMYYSYDHVGEDWSRSVDIWFSVRGVED
jgi:uncharacterized protein (TIGR02145 family)